MDADDDTGTKQVEDYNLNSDQTGEGLGETDNVVSETEPSSSIAEDSATNTKDDLPVTRKSRIFSILKSSIDFFMMRKKTIPISTTNVEGQQNDGKDATGAKEVKSTTTTQEVDTKHTSSKASKNWGISIPSVGTILQCIFYAILIGQNVSGPHSDFWPFQSSNTAQVSTTSSSSTPRSLEIHSDMYGDERQFVENYDDKFGLISVLFGRTQSPKELPENTGIPKEQHIVLKLLNREYETYRYSVQAATKSKVVASTEFGQVSFQRALKKALYQYSNHNDRMRLAIMEDRFLDKAGELVDKMKKLKGSIGQFLDKAGELVDKTKKLKGSIGSNATSDIGQCNTTNTTTTFPFDYSSSEVLQCDTTPVPILDQFGLDTNSTNSTSSSFVPTQESTSVNQTNVTSSSLHLEILANGTKAAVTMIDETYSEICTLIKVFLNEVIQSFPTAAANQLGDVINGHRSIFGCHAVVNDLRKSPMRLHFTMRKKRFFVTYFLGDLLATAVSALRKEVTAIVLSAEVGDEVLVVLQSGGGTVTGYGLVAAQLLRIKDAGLKLTIAVEQVAASGGYMAACVADNIICSPFAVVGSIGVIQEMPNLYERLKREGVEFHQITAGDWKRVLSPTKEVNESDLKKAKEDIEDVWQLFKDFVFEHRPSLNMDKVATGEVWFGKRALDVGLCDSIQASDAVLTEFVDRGYDVYEVKHKEPVEDIIEKFLGTNSKDSSATTVFGLLFCWFMQKATFLLQKDGTDFSKLKDKAESWSSILLV